MNATTKLQTIPTEALDQAAGRLLCTWDRLYAEHASAAALKVGTRYRSVRAELDRRHDERHAALLARLTH